MIGQFDLSDRNLGSTAWTRWNGGSVRAGSGMAQEGADLVGCSGREDVLELAGLLFDHRFAVNSQTVGEEALGEAMTANNAARLAPAARCERNDGAAVTNENSLRAHGIMAGIYEWLMIVRLGWVRGSGDQSQLFHLFNRDAYG